MVVKDKMWSHVNLGKNTACTCVSVDLADRVWLGTMDGRLFRSDTSASETPRFQAVGSKHGGSIEGVWSDGKERVVACIDGAVVQSMDAGVSWTPTTCKGKYNSNLSYQGGLLIASNIRSKVLISTDEGKKWSSLDTKNKRYLYSVAANTSGVLGAGSDESVVISRDYGKSWKVLKLSHRQYMRGAHVFADGEILFVGDEGKVHLVDKNDHVLSYHQPQTRCLYSLVEGGDTVWAVGHDDYQMTAVVSRDRGKTWSLSPLPKVTRGQLSAVCVQQKTRIIAVGESGTIWTMIN